MVLRILYNRLRETDLIWAVSGSTGFALQGVPAEPRDIDLQSNEAGSYRIEELFSEYVLRPVRFSQAERIRSHFGALSIEGLEVEIMGDIQKRRDDGSWEGPPDLRRYRRVVDVEGMSL
ncbi:MAG: hypothetical protein JOZ41_05575, partial [Chloroflexi bacterium]|nr:hypothetical protein [Chloroflexota bacterium]